MINLRINDKEVSVEEDTTILHAAEYAGVNIPSLCYYKGLSPATSCRICIVEVEGLNNFVPACSYTVSDGMQVYTHTDRILTARKIILELILSNHAQNCIICEKNGICKLQEYAYELGVEKSRFEGRKHNIPIDTSNPFIERDYNKCILCGRCVTICHQEQKKYVIDYINRGFDTRIGTYFDRPLQDTGCVFCGQCVQVCPVGALTEKQAIGKARVWQVKKIPTICPYCGCGCSIELNVKDNQIIKVTADDTQGINKGRLCIKGRFGYEFVQRDDRLTQPLVRKNGRLVETSWDEAFDIIVNKLKAIKDKYHPDVIGGIASARCTNEENYLFQKFIRAVIGTNNVDHCARLCHASTVVGLAAAFGSGAMTNSIEEIKDTDCILLTGSNTTECHPIIATEIMKAVDKGAKLIVVDPRRIELCDIATLYMQQKPGTDVVWLNAMMNVIISEGWHNEEFIKTRCEGFDEFKQTVDRYSPEYAAKITGIAPDKIIEAARMYAHAKNACVIYSMGITQHTTGVNNVFCIANLAMLTGNIGKRSAGVLPLRGQNNVQGACDMGALPNVYPGYQPVSDNNIRLKFERAWDIGLSGTPGLTLEEMIDSKDIKALYIMGENPVVSSPDINHVKQALQNIEFLIVQDIFLTETAQLAHVVLPGVSFAEKYGTFTNTERRIQRIRKAINPPGMAMVDWEIICEIACRMGYEMTYQSVEQIMDEIAKLTPLYAGVSYDRLKNNGLQWPCPDKDHPGTPYLHKDKFTRGKGKFHPVEYIPSNETTNKKYPYILTTGRILQHYHSGSMTRRCDALEWICNENYVEISPVDAEILGITTGDMVKVSTARGEIDVKARITDRIKPGVIFIPFHFVESAANILTNTALDPKAKIPELKVCAANIQKK